MLIKEIKAREVLDSRANPTVACRIILKNGISAEAMVPSGASTGTHEALELRDGDKKRYQGKGVLQAVRNINTLIAPKMKGKEFKRITEIDRLLLKLDGTKNKSKLGANAILAVSLASAKVGALAGKKPLYEFLRQNYKLDYRSYRLPHPMMNVINGGAHADNALEIQEFLIVPQAQKFSERVRQGAEVFHALKAVLKSKKYNTACGDEGGFAPAIKTGETALALIYQAIKQAGYQPGKDVGMALDLASSELYEQGKYILEGKKLTGIALIKKYQAWLERYPIISFEDPLAEDDWQHWQIMTHSLGEQVQIIGDDLFVTNVERLQMGIKQQAGNAILIKLNQIGTLSETIACVQLAQASGYKVIISHRSGETEDTTIADLAAAVNADFIKTSISHSERVAKYNRLLEIADELGL